jgi:hypothetical protein
VKLVVVALLLNLAHGLNAQTTKQPISGDVSGWDKIRWGMTIAQAAALYKVPKTNAEKGKDGWTLLKLPQIMVAGTKMNVRVAAQLNKISEVAISPVSDDPFKQTIESLKHQLGKEDAAPKDTSARPLFEKLKVLLIQKYGHPTEEVPRTPDADDADYMRTSVLWVFPSTSISLELDEAKLFNDVGITYKAKEKSGVL